MIVCNFGNSCTELSMTIRGSNTVAIASLDVAFKSAKLALLTFGAATSGSTISSILAMSLVVRVLMPN